MLYCVYNILKTGMILYIIKTKTNMKKFKKSFKKSCKKCKECLCQEIKYDLDKCHKHLLLGTYVLCACLVVYSLLIFNGILAQTNESFDSKTNNYITYAVEDVWMDTVFFSEKVGATYNNLLHGTIETAVYRTTQVFVKTGNFLSRIPDILTAPPPQVMARGT